jgi:general secretion pathway protein I
MRGLTRGAGSRPAEDNAGFSLLEVLVATVIMGIAVTALIVGLTQSVKNASRLSEYDHAAMLARAKMNDLLLDVDLPFDGPVQGSFDASSGWRATLRPYDMPPNAFPGQVILQQVALEVWWQPPAGTRRTMQLSGYRPMRIPVSQ